MIILAPIFSSQNYFRWKYLDAISCQVSLPNLIVRLSESYCSSVTLRGPPLSGERKELSETRWCQNDRIFKGFSVIRRPWRMKSRGPKGLQLEVGAQRAPRLLVWNMERYTTELEMFKIYGKTCLKCLKYGKIQKVLYWNEMIYSVFSFCELSDVIRKQ